MRVWLLLLVCAAYANTLLAGFQFDDFRVIAGNPAVHRLRSWWLAAPHGIRPLLSLSYALNWSLAPYPVSFHLVNGLIHAMNVLLVHRLACRHLGPGPGSFFAAALFALHPVQTEAVSYVCGRSVSLGAMGCLLAIESREWPRTGWILSPLFFLAALLVRETALVLPLALLLWDRLGGRSWAESWRRVVPHAILAAAAAAVPFLQGGYRQFFESSLGLRPVLANLCTQVEGLGYLASRLVLPWRLNIDPDLRPLQQADGWHLLGVLLLLALGVAALLRFRPGRADWAFAILWCLLWLLPTNSVFPRRDVASERHLYLAITGFCLMAGGLVDGVLARFPVQRKPALLSALALILALGGMTVMRNRAYTTEVTLWEDTIRKSPYKARPHNNLGYAYEREGRAIEARREYQRALDLDPHYDLARRNLQRLAP
ncbi:MAG TPA: tetratricopeptide repeat protein [Geothrix sp.]|nr:tetratricopeptide repeat protein [Geothrix sp.]